MKPGDLIMRVSFPSHEADIWKDPCVVIKGPYEDHVQVTAMNNKPIVVVRQVVDVLNKNKVYTKIPVFEFKSKKP